jgi:hypothetical protein
MSSHLPWFDPVKLPEANPFAKLRTGFDTLVASPKESGVLRTGAAEGG